MKVLQVKPEKCIGCRTCEIVCSFAHNGKSNPRFANIKVVPFEKAGIQVPITCQQCEHAACMEVCPVHAISRDEIGAVIINHEKCIGCKTCMNACPLGNIGVNTEKKQMHKCDLCGGDPNCVKFCPSGALTFADPDEDQDRRKLIATAFKKLFGEEEVK